MSGPYCGSCVHWYKWVRGDIGECKDPTKRIYYRYGDARNDAPIASETDYCSNHKSDELAQAQGEEE